MTLRAGSYNAARPRWRGVLREDSYPAMVCTHQHRDQAEATRCARDALAAVRAAGVHGPLPAGWLAWDPSMALAAGGGL